MNKTTQVIIIGGGIAGLSTAVYLHRQGISFKLLEADNRVGGRVKTDIVDGYRLDQGFQVLLTAYPEAQALLDYKSLDLKTFLPGSLILKNNGKRSTIGDPARWMGSLLGTVFSGVGSWGDKLKILSLRKDLATLSIDAIFEQEETTTLQYLRNYGFSESMIDQFFRPFFSGIFLEKNLNTSSRMFSFIFKMFSEGQAAVPAKGMEAIVQQLVAQLPADSILTEQEVVEIDDISVSTSQGLHFEAEKIIFATQATGIIDDFYPNIKEKYHSTSNLYFAADKSPIKGAIVALNAKKSALINNVCVLSEVSPDYAPNNKALVSVSIVGLEQESDETLSAKVKAELQQWFGTDVRQWQFLKSYHIGYALPSAKSSCNKLPLDAIRLDETLYVCGDHLLNGSLNAAMKSGRLVAELVKEDFEKAGSPLEMLASV